MRNIKQSSWEQEITEIEAYFTETVLPDQPIQLNQCMTIIDCAEFVDSHLAAVKASTGKRAFLPYLERLQALKVILKTS